MESRAKQVEMFRMNLCILLASCLAPEYFKLIPYVGLYPLRYRI